MSRVHLAGRLSVSRTTIAAEVPGSPSSGWHRRSAPRPPAAVGARRWSTCARPPLRRDRHRRDGPVGGGHRRTVPVLGHPFVRLRHRQGPETGARHRAPRGARPARRERDRQPLGAGIAVPGPVDFHRGVPVSPPIMPGWDGYPVRDAVSRSSAAPVLDNDVNVMAIGEQHAGVARAPATSSSSRSAPESVAASSSTASFTGASTGAPATSATSASRIRPGLRLRQHRLSGGVLGGAALARDATAAARAGRSPILAGLLEQKGELTAADVGLAVAQRRCPRGAAGTRQRSPDRTGARQPGVVLQPRADRHRRPGDRAGSLAAGRDPWCHLPPLAAPGHRQPADRAQRARRRERSHRRGPADQQLCVRAPGRRPRMTRLVAGVDSSTQSCKVVVRDADTGELVREGRARAPRRHRGRPGGLVGGARRRRSSRPAGWTTWRRCRVGGQQHGMVCLDEAGAVVRPALLWNDTRSAGAAADLVDELGGRGRGPGPTRSAWCRSPPSRSPSCAGWPSTSRTTPRATAAVCLPHDWLTWRLARRRPTSRAGHRPQRRQRHRLLVGRDRRVPPRPARLGVRLATPLLPRCSGRPSRAGHDRRRRRPRRRAPATTRPPRSASAPGRATWSSRSGTSGVVSAVADARRPPTRPAPSPGSPTRPAATCRWCARSTRPACSTPAARMLGVDHAGCRELALSAPPGADGLVLVPYLEGERTPNRPTPPARCTG